MVPATVLPSQVTERPAFEKVQSQGETNHSCIHPQANKYKLKVSNRERTGESTKEGFLGGDNAS